MSSAIIRNNSGFNIDQNFKNWTNDNDNAKKVITSFFKKVQGSNFIERWYLTVKDSLCSLLKWDKAIFTQRKEINKLRLDIFINYLNKENSLCIVDENNKEVFNEIPDKAEGNLLNSKVGKGVNKLFDDISTIYAASKKSKTLPSPESYIKEQYFIQMFNKDINAVCNGSDSEQKTQVKNFLAFLHENNLKGEDANRAIKELLHVPKFDIQHPENYLPHFFKNTLLDKINSFLNKDNINKLNQSIKEFSKKCESEQIQHFYIRNIKSKLHTLFNSSYHEQSLSGGMTGLSEHDKISAYNEDAINYKIKLINEITEDIDEFKQYINNSPEGMQMFSGPLGTDLQNIIKNYDPTALFYSFCQQHIKGDGDNWSDVYNKFPHWNEQLTPYQYSTLNPKETKKLNKLFHNLPDTLNTCINMANYYKDKAKVRTPQDILLGKIRDALGINIDADKNDALFEKMVKKEIEKSKMEEIFKNDSKSSENLDNYENSYNEFTKPIEEYNISGIKPNANKDKVALYNKLKQEVEKSSFYRESEDGKYKALTGDNNDLQFNLIKLVNMLPNQDKPIINEANFKTLVEYLALPKEGNEKNKSFAEAVSTFKRTAKFTIEKINSKIEKQTLSELKTSFKGKITANKDKKTLFNKEIDGLCDSFISFLRNEKTKEKEYGYTDKTANFFLLNDLNNKSKSECYLYELESKIDSYKNSKEIESIKNNYNSCIEKIEKGYKATLALSNKKWGTYWEEGQEKEEKKINTLQKMYAAYSLYKAADNKPSVV